MLLALAVAGTIRALGPSFVSDVIAEPWDRLDGAAWLRPGLDGSKVTMPTRPLSNAESSIPQDVLLAQVTRVAEFSVSTNASRLRGEPIPAEQDGVPRILVVGDSVAFGWGVEDDESWPVALERHLRAKGLPVQVINASMPGTTSATMLLYCERVGPSHQADLVIWSRRPQENEPPPFDTYMERILACREALDLPMLLMLPPVGSFHWLHPHWQQESRRLRQRADQAGLPMLELTEVFDAAAQNSGYSLRSFGDEIQLVNNATGEVRGAWPPAMRVDAMEHPNPPRGIPGPQQQPTYDADAPAGPSPTPQPGPLPPEFYELLEQDHSIVESLFVDDGHANPAGNELTASEVAKLIEPMLTAL